MPPVAVAHAGLKVPGASRPSYTGAPKPTAISVIGDDLADTTTMSGLPRLGIFCDTLELPFPGLSPCSLSAYLYVAEVL